jgi:ferredoxin-NADP reductase
VTLTLRIRDVAPATPRARLVRLDLDGHGFDYAAGQAVLVGNHGGEAKRPYSIASAPEDALRDRALELLVGVRENGEAGDHLTLREGADIDVDGPLGSFTYPPHVVERHVVFIAGGTGIAPLRAMLRHAMATRPAPERIGLLYSARTPNEFAFAGEFRELAAARAIEFRQTVTREAASDWSGARGRIDRVALATLVHTPETLCFICGPRALVDDMPGILLDLGIARERIRIEEWG